MTEKNRYGYLCLDGDSEAVARLVNYDAWFTAEVDKGLAAADRGELTDHQTVRELIDRRAPAMSKGQDIMVNLSGRGDKDMGILSRELHLGSAPAENKDTR